MYYPCSENKGADQLRGYREADLRLCFRIGKNPVFSRCGSDENEGLYPSVRTYIFAIASILGCLEIFSEIILIRGSSRLVYRLCFEF